MVSMTRIKHRSTAQQHKHCTTGQQPPAPQHPTTQTNKQKQTNPKNKTIKQPPKTNNLNQQQQTKNQIPKQQQTNNNNLLPIERGDLLPKLANISVENVGGLVLQIIGSTHPPPPNWIFLIHHCQWKTCK